MPPRFLDTNILLRYFTRDTDTIALSWIDSTPCLARWPGCCPGPAGGARPRPAPKGKPSSLAALAITLRALSDTRKGKCLFFKVAETRQLM